MVTIKVIFPYVDIKHTIKWTESIKKYIAIIDSKTFLFVDFFLRCIVLELFLEKLKILVFF